jgi:hypothetical protein
MSSVPARRRARFCDGVDVELEVQGAEKDSIVSLEICVRSALSPHHERGGFSDIRELEKWSLNMYIFFLLLT